MHERDIYTVDSAVIRSSNNKGADRNTCFEHPDQADQTFWSNLQKL